MILDSALTGTEPVLLILTHGETLRTDVSKALTEAEKSGLQVVRVNVNEKPEYAEQFQVGKHPVLVAWHCGEVVARRSRPWGTDASEIVKSVKALATPTETAEGEQEIVAEDAPVHVTDQDFIEKVLQSELPVLVDFWAEWCGPCRMVAPILDKLAKEFAGKIRIAKVDVDANPMLSQQFRIQSIPTLMFVKEGKIVGMSAGAAPEPALRDVIQQLLDLDVSALEAQQ